jgi:DNA-binding LacI/PurR family transcriptional regulator
MADVAKMAGVSAKTVSNVLADYEHVRKATRDRVLAAVDELGYQINVSARNLRSGRTRVIGLAVPELREAYFAELSDAVIRSADRHGYTVLIEQTNARRSREIQTIGGMRKHMVDGLIFSPLALGPDDADYLNTDFPLVVLGERIVHSAADHITMSNVAAANVVTQHLISIGRRRIAVIGAHPDDPVGTASLRLRGYATALEEAGIVPDPSLVIGAPLWHRSDGARATRALLDSGLDIDAIFCFNDALALGALRVLQSRGIRVPEDIALAGYDDIEDSRYSTPTLTSVSPGREQIAATAVEMLVRRLEGGEERRRPTEVEADFELRVRESTVGLANRDS